MGTSPETFNQVKNILRKLDRSIDDARSRRMTTPADATPQPAAPFDPSRAGRARPLARPTNRPSFG